MKIQDKDIVELIDYVAQYRKAMKDISAKSLELKKKLESKIDVLLYVIKKKYE